MALCEELAVPCSSIRGKLHDGQVKAKIGDGSVWEDRFLVLSSNVLSSYLSADDMKPDRVTFLDYASVQTTEAKDSDEAPYGFRITSATGLVSNFAVADRAACQKWVAAISTSQYQLMFRKHADAESMLRKTQMVLQHASEGKEGPTPDIPTAVRELITERDNALSSSKHLQGAVQIVTAERDNETSRRMALEAELEATRKGGSAADGVAEERIRLLEKDVAEAKSKSLAESARAEKLDRDTVNLTRDLEAARNAESRLRERVAELERKDSASKASSDALSSAQIARARAEEETANLRVKVASLEAKNSDLATLLENTAEDAARQRDARQTAERDRDKATETVQALEKAASAAAVSASASAAAAAAAAAASGNAEPASPSRAELSGMDRSGALALPPVDGEAPDPYEHEWLPYYREGQRLERAGRLPQAEDQYMAVLKIRTDRSGPSSVAVATANRDLGRVLAQQKRFDGAEACYTKSVDLCSKLLGEEHPNTACALTDLASVLRDQSKFVEAESAARRAVSALRISVGPEDVSTATALYNLAGLSKRQAKYDEAEKSYSEALAIFQVKIGSGKGETADTLYQLGVLHRKRRDYATAQRYFDRAGESYAAAYGNDDRRVEEAFRRSRSMAARLAAERRK